MLGWVKGSDYGGRVTVLVDGRPFTVRILTAVYHGMLFRLAALSWYRKHEQYRILTIARAPDPLKT